jgi:hypothetical protein
MSEKVAGGDTGHGWSPRLRPTNRKMVKENFIVKQTASKKMSDNYSAT